MVLGSGYLRSIEGVLNDGHSTRDEQLILGNLLVENLKTVWNVWTRVHSIPVLSCHVMLNLSRPHSTIHHTHVAI